MNPGSNPGSPALNPITLGLWQARLDPGPAQLAEFEAGLDASERTQAAALRGGQLRDRYVADHGWRRRLLGQQLGCEPAQVEYVVSEQGKPEPTGGRLRFSASRSDTCALYAVTDAAAVGVDLERLREDVDLDAMAGRFFSPRERATFEALEPRQRTAAGFACWTRKEAWVKADGTGLVFPLSELEVWAGDDRPVRHGEFVVATVDAGPGYAAAVAVRAAPDMSIASPHAARVVSATGTEPAVM